eukprot:TRINITY_DN260_c0_g2_i6.p2 TRINITY_DN260_c0_g2~~TRINITY_DN260_c0_g2_i6.p2  ORF type:complete len:111 (-),score=23.52 TRINITY_DN260_c0_g2_i6:758-1090(-)
MEQLIEPVAQEGTQDFLQNVEIMVETDWAHVFATAIGYFELLFRRLNTKDELQLLMVCFLLAEKYLLDICDNNAQCSQQRERIGLGSIFLSEAEHLGNKLVSSSLNRTRT